MQAPSDVGVDLHPENPRTLGRSRACIELDRFCLDCGYNLRTLPVRRDGETGIPVVRCPECGRFQSANDATTALRPWLHRAISGLLLLWVLTIVAAFIHLGLAEGALSSATLEELTEPRGYTTRQGNNTTTVWRRGLAPLAVKRDSQDYELFITAILMGSFGTAFVCGTFAVVVLPHWPKVRYFVLVLAIPVVTGAVVAAIWNREAPHLFIWGLRFVTAHAGAQVLGGLIGVISGRPLARFAARTLLPPGVRPSLAFLWLADGKPLPRQ